jgi:hypothetical protein
LQFLNRKKEHGQCHRTNDDDQQHGQYQSSDFPHVSLLFEPKIEAMQDADWEHDCPSQQEAPQALSKASEDVCQPCGKTRNPNNCA